MIRQYFFTTLAISFIFLFSAFSSPHAQDTEHSGPQGVFFAPHMENGTTSPDYLYQQENWPRLVQMIAIANQYDAKITLLFNPKWAEYILMDEQRHEMLNQWQQMGHEVGLHYHAVTHVDWNGYTDREDDVYEKSLFHQGTVPQMMELMDELAAPQKVVTACVGPDMATEKNPTTYLRAPVPPGFIDEIDFPDDIIYDIDGIRDGRTRPIAFEFNGRVRIHLRHGVARSKSEVEDRIEEISTAHSDEIIGLVTHASDFDPQLLHEIFQYLRDRQIQVQTVREIMENYPLHLHGVSQLD